MRDNVRTDLRFRGVGVKSFYVHDGKNYGTLRDMHQWEVLGGQCSKCGHVGWLDRKAVIAKIGNHYLMNLRQKLHCIACDYRGMNDVLIGHLDRNI